MRGDGGRQACRFWRLGGIRRAVGEAAIHLAEQRHHRKAQRLQERHRDGSPVPLPASTTSDGRREPRPQRLAHEPQVRAQDVEALPFTLAVYKVPGAELRQQSSQLVPMQAVSVKDDLEAVVARRIVAAGDHHARAAAQVVHGKIKQGEGTMPMSRTRTPVASSPSSSAACKRGE